MRFTQPPEGNDENFDVESRLTEQRDQRVSPFIVGGAIVGVFVGLFLWGSLALAAFSGMMSVFDSDDGSPGVADTTGEEVENLPLTEDATIDCDAFGPTRALSPEQEAAFQEQCVTPTPEPEAEPEGESEGPAPSEAGPNRESCDEIRGTDYRSAEERQWFLDNCVN